MILLGIVLPSFHNFLLKAVMMCLVIRTEVYQPIDMKFYVNLARSWVCFMFTVVVYARGFL